MYFNLSFKKYFILITTLLVVVGCSDFLRGKKQDDAKVKISAGDMECLKTAPDKIAAFVDDVASDAQIKEAIGCFSESIAKFATYTKGDEVSHYRSDELRHFLNRYLLKSQQISPSFMEEIMAFKVIAIGGEKESLTRAEVEKLKTFLILLQEQMIILNGHIKVLTFKADSKSLLESHLSAVEMTLSRVVGNFILGTEISKSQYGLSDFKEFLNQISLHLKKDEDKDSTLAAIQLWIPVVDKVKTLFLGESSKLSSTQDWLKSSGWVVSAYSFALRYYYLTKGLELSTPEEWRTMLTTLDRGVKLVETAPVLESGNMFAAEDIDAAIEELWKLKLFKTRITADIAKNTYRRLIVHILEAPKAGRGNPNLVIGLNKNHIAVLKEEYLIWRTTQEFINQAFLQSEGFITLESLIKAAKEYRLIDHVKGMQVSTLQMEQLQRNWADWIKILTQSKPIIWNKNSRMIFNYQSRGVHLGFTGVSLSNAMRSLTQILLRGYSVQTSRHLFENSIPEQAFLDFEEDFREFGRAINFLDPRHAKSAARTFKEGNFFTYKGNGDKFLDAIEAYEVFSMLFSGGMNLAGQIHRALGALGCHLPDLDVFDKNVVSEQCFLSHINEKYADYFDGMPWMVRYLNKLSTEQRKAFFLATYQVSLLEGKRPGTSEFTEIRTTTSVAQYIESLIMKYDTDRDGVLAEGEIIAALPRFEQFIIELSPLKDWFVEDIFLYLVFEGKKPTGLSDMAKFKLKRVRGLGHVDRLKLVNVLAVLKADATGPEH